MRKFLIILLCCLALLSCVSIAITTGNGDTTQTKQEAEHEDQPEVNIGVNE